ncbi:MAG: phosphoglycolate phosphatase [Hyphomicrobiales bacterium]
MANAVVFDLDGTLVDSAPDLAAATNHVLAAHGRRPVSLDEVRAMVGRGARKLIERGFAATGEAVDMARMDDLYRLFIDHYRANIDRGTRPFEGTLDVLEQCRTRGLKVGICTNKTESLSVLLIERLGLTKAFGAIVGADTIGIAKPDPAPYRETLARLEATGRSVMVGDSETDILTARAAGVPVIAVTFGYTDKPVETFAPDRLASSMGEVWRHIEEELL